MENWPRGCTWPISMNHSRSILRTSPICFGATKNFTVLLSSVSGVLRIRSTNALEDCSYTATTSINVAGALHLAELDPAVQRLLARLLLRHEHPRELSRGLTLGVRLQVCLRSRVGLEHPHRGRELFLQLGQELLLLSHAILLA